jgi:hypothetical protein
MLGNFGAPIPKPAPKPAPAPVTVKTFPAQALRGGDGIPRRPDALNDQWIG